MKQGGEREKILQAFFDGCDTRFRETPNPIAQAGKAKGPKQQLHPS